VAPGGSFASSRRWERCRATPGAVFFGGQVRSLEKNEDALIGFLKKPWWVGPLIAGVSYNHYHADKPPEPAAVSGYEVVHNRGNLPRNGRVVVVATCPAGKRAISGGFSTPSPADTTDFSNPEGNNAWKVSFKSNGGSGNASVYAVCVNAN
jgi:hypothetical protein